jgi:hypothetical protein
MTLRPGISDELSLDYSNIEVLNSMSRLLTQNIFADDNNYARNRLLVALMNRDIKKLIKVLNELLAGIPYDDFSYAAEQTISLSGSDMTAREWLYRSTILAFMRGCGVVIFPEIHINLGRSDLVVLHKSVYWVIEIKVACEGNNPVTKAKQALKQIETKNYSSTMLTNHARPYPDAINVVLVIDDVKRQIIEDL